MSSSFSFSSDSSISESGLSSESVELSSSSSSSSESDSSEESCSSCSGCIVFGIDPATVPICVGADQQFTADGDVLDELSWTTTPAGTPATGTGPNFTTKWTTVGLGRKVTATCTDSGSFSEATVDVVGVDKIVVDGTTNEGPVTINDGTSVLLRALRTPTPTSGPWPANRPQWTISQTPGPFNAGHLESVAGDPGVVRFFPSLDPNDATPATYKVKATCGSSSDEFTINVNRCVVTGVSADKSYEKVASTGHAFNVVGVKSSAADHVTLTITVAAGTDKTKLTWHGDVTVVAGSDNLQAKVPIDASVRKDILIKYDGVACHEIRVWPVWATISNFRGDNAQGETLSADNNPANGDFATGCPGLGTPATCDKGTFNQMEMRATLTPLGVSALAGTGTSVQFDFKRTVQSKGWKKDAADATWTETPGLVRPAGTSDDTLNVDEDLHDKNDVIWVIDSLGIEDGLANKDFLAVEVQALEFVHLVLNESSNKTTAMSGQRISAEQAWYAILNLKKNGLNGKWERNTARRNEIKTGTITIGTQPQ